MPTPPADFAWAVVTSTVQLFAILNPISVVPTFLELTEGMSEGERVRVVRRAAASVLAISCAFALVGEEFLGLVGVSVADLEFGGGILLTVLALDMLKGVARTREVEREDIAVVPLATPLLVGPGTITTVVVLSTSLETQLGGRVQGEAALLSAVAAAAAATYVLLRYSTRMVVLLGRNGTRALGRFMALIIAGMAAEMLRSAVLGWVSGV